MEGIALILIGTAIFTHSWHQLGLYADGRAVGALMAGLAGALILSLFVFEPQFMGEIGKSAPVKADETVALKSLIIGWGVYMVVVGAQCFWDLEERAIGFFGILLFFISMVVLIFYLQLWIGNQGEALTLVPMFISTALMTIVGGLLFFFMAIPFPGLRSVSGWVSLLFSIVIVAIGMMMVTPVLV